MKSTPQRMNTATIVISTIAIVILIATFVINGSELDDLWLYIVSISIVLIVPIESYFSNKSKK